MRVVGELAETVRVRYLLLKVLLLVIDLGLGRQKRYFRHGTNKQSSNFYI